MAVTVSRGLLIGILAVATVGCESDARPASSEQIHAGSAVKQARLENHADFSGKAVVALTSGAGAVRPAAAPPIGQVRLPQAASGMIVRNGSVSVRVDSIELAVDQARALASRLGGTLAGVAINNGEHQVRSATLELKIPAGRFDEAMMGVRPLGRVEHSTTTAVDVGEEYVDVVARIANARRLEKRLVSLLESRTGKLEDVLAVERELARVREEIERYEGRIRYLDTRIATSTIVVNLQERAPIVAAHPGANPIRQAFVNMWRNFVMVIAGGIEALGILVPVVVLVAAFVVGWKRWRRSRLAVSV